MKDLHRSDQPGAAPKSRPPMRGPMGGPMRGPGGHMSMTAEKPKDFKRTLKRLVKFLEPRKIGLLAVLLTAIISTVFSIVSPKILGRATTELFRGLMAKMTGVPGAAINFDYILQIVLILAGLYIVSVGSLNTSLVHPREVFGPALAAAAAALVLFHNHPSGDPVPSGEDLALTRRLKAGGDLLGVEILDHLIIGSGSGRWVSLKERGHI